MSERKRKNLVTGGAGFIGSHLCEKLIDNGERVIIIDDFSTGRRENLKEVEDSSDFELIVGSVLDEELVDDCVEWADRVFHLAAAVGVKYIIDNPLQSLQVNVGGTENVLEACCKYESAVFLASTSEVYGKNDNVPFSEDNDRVLGPTEISRWGYSCAKALDEFFGFAYNEQSDLPVVIGRFFNTVGPRQSGQYGMVIPSFVERAKNDEEITVHGDGKQTRAFIDVDDTTDAVLELMDREECYGEVYNIGGSNPIEIKELAKKIVDMTGSNSELSFIPYEEVYGGDNFEDMRHRVPDVSKLHDEIGFSQTYDIDGILNRIIDFFESNEDFK